MYRSLPATALVLALAAAPASAQHMATLSDSTIVGERLYDRLFEGIPLDSAASVRAHSLIVRTFVEQQDIGFVFLQGTWLKVVALQQARDSALADLVPNKNLRTVLLDRAKQTRPRHHFWNWPEP